MGTALIWVADFYMVRHGSGDDYRATGVLQPTQARYNRQRAIYALMGKMFQPGRVLELIAG
jgi:hypothetical protein